MSAWIVALMVSVGASTWVYTKLQRRSGNNTKQSLIATGITGLILFGVILSVLSLIF